jgi:hypothetical protein
MSRFLRRVGLSLLLVALAIVVLVGSIGVGLILACRAFAAQVLESVAMGLGLAILALTGIPDEWRRK